jgi:hypothetical protein
MVAKLFRKYILKLIFLLCILLCTLPHVNVTLDQQEHKTIMLTGKESAGGDNSTHEARLLLPSIGADISAAWQQYKITVD